MCKRPSADHPGADGTAALGREQATLHQELTEPPCLQVRCQREDTTEEEVHKSI